MGKHDNNSSLKMNRHRRRFLKNLGLGSAGLYVSAGPLAASSALAQFIPHGFWRNRVKGTNFWMWGDGTGGGLGNGVLASKSTPQQISSTATDWTSGVAGSGHINGLRSDGSLWFWGSNSYGQRGNGTKDAGTSSPVQIPISNVSAVGSGTFHVMALKSDGTLWGWGNLGTWNLGIPTWSPTIQVGTDTNWSKIYAGGSFCLALKSDGSLWSWGTSSGGALGNSSTASVYVPTQVGSDTNWSRIILPSTLGSVVLALKTDQTLWYWGTSPAFGLASTSSPVQVGSDTDWVDACAPSGALLAVKANGSLWTRGVPSSALGIYFWKPVQVVGSNYASVSGGASFSMAVKSDGTLWGWGVNFNGQLGTGFTSQSIYSPVQVGTSTNWGSVVCTGSHAMALKSDGTLWGWGVNTYGQLGTNDTINRSSPVQIGSTGWQAVATGNSHTLALQSSGTLWSWGANNSGQLGLGDTVSRSSPVQIGSGTSWTTVVSGDYHCGAGYSNGFGNFSLYTWGYNNGGQLGVGDTVNRSSPIQVGMSIWSQVSFGSTHSLALQPDGSLWAWGTNSSGQLGLGDVTNRLSPVQVGALTNWKQIGAGSNASAGIKTDGSLFAWGNNYYGGLGTGDTANRSSPVQIGTATNWSYVIPGGYTQTLALDTSGNLFAWGRADTGQLGLLYSSFVQVGNATWKSLASGAYVALGIRTDGTLWSWGQGTYGQLGYPPVGDTVSPAQVGALTNWSQISTGGAYSVVALKTDNTLWGWGSNTNGQLGLNDTSNRSSPVQVGVQANWSKISCGWSYTMALKSDGSLWSFGTNPSGQLGVGDALGRSSPVQIGVGNVYTDVSCGFDHALALKNDGSLWIWGNITYVYPTYFWQPRQVLPGSTWAYISPIAGNGGFAIKSDGTLWGWGGNSGGTVGNGTNTSVMSPVQIGAATNWTQALCSNGHSVAIRSDGTLWTWGTNGNGQLGQGDIAARSVPTQVGTMTNWASVAVGNNGSHTMAIKTDGTLWAWGLNGAGQLGDGTTVAKSSPVQIGSGTNWDKVACGFNNTIARKTDGTIWCWGQNFNGQVGDGTVTGRSSPVQVGSGSDWKSVLTGNGFTGALK